MTTLEKPRRGFGKGSTHSLATRQKMSEDRRGKKMKEEAYQWKGLEAGYIAKHMWIYKHHGKADHCENSSCEHPSPKRYEWANISGKYLRDVSDYKQLCPSCHKKFDNPHPNHCRRGHELTEENSYWHINKSSGIRQRYCRSCLKINDQAKKQRKNNG